MIQSRSILVNISFASDATSLGKPGFDIVEGLQFLVRILRERRLACLPRFEDLPDI